MEADAIQEKPILQTHDRSFKAALSDPRVAKDFLDHHLPIEIKAIVDLNTIKTEKESYVDEELELLITDVLFSVQLKNSNKRCLLYFLVEHLSTNDPLAAWRVIKYTCRVIEDYLQKMQSKELPLVFSLVAYNGKAKCSLATSIFDLFGEHKELAKLFMFDRFHLIDFSQIPDEEIRQRKWSVLLEMLMKHAFSRDVMTYLESMSGIVKNLARENADNYILGMLKYALERMELQDPARFETFLKASLPSEMEEEAMTLAQVYKQQGRQEVMQEAMTLAQVYEQRGLQTGWQEGRQEGIQIGVQQGVEVGMHQTLLVLDMLRQGGSLEKIIQATGLNQTQVLEIQKHLQN